jgi:uncharacterized flavoprotein (TIGR03862 family)
VASQGTTSTAEHYENRAVVVGGGPAGLIAAEVLANGGASVTVFDHMPSVGRKLLLAGRGGLNLTHSEPFDQLIGRYGTTPTALRTALRRFDSAALRAWCAELGEPTFIGTSGRVFPRSFRATPLLRSWLARLHAAGVEIETRWRWVGFEGPNLLFEGRNGERQCVPSDVSVFALGGASWPRVGSDGGWVEPFRSIGVTVNDLRPSNCGVRVGWSPVFADRFAGEPLKNVAVAVAGPVSGAASRGDVMITTDGLEGGPIYAHSRSVRDALDRDGIATLVIDLHPDLAETTLIERLRLRRSKESTTNFLRRAAGLAPTAIALLREATGNDLPAESDGLASAIKAVSVTVVDTTAIDRAISTAGGIAWSELDESFMLRARPGTFVAGEMIDWDAPTGGYLLQATFSTAVAAAGGALGWLESRAARP